MQDLISLRICLKTQREGHTRALVYMPLRNILWCQSSACKSQYLVRVFMQQVRSKESFFGGMEGVGVISTCL